MTIVLKNYFNPAAQGQHGWTYVRLVTAMSVWAWCKVTRRIRAEKLANKISHAITGTPLGWHIFKCSGVAQFEVTDDIGIAEIPGKNGNERAINIGRNRILHFWNFRWSPNTQPKGDLAHLEIELSGGGKARNHSLKVVHFQVTGGGSSQCRNALN